MKEVFNILQRIGDTSSRNEKLAILTQNKDNKDLAKVFEYTYNPYKVYGIGSKTFKKTETKSEFKDIFELLNWLLEHNTGSDADKDKVNAFLQANPTETVWYQRMILKDLRVQATATLANKVWPGLIPEFDVMLAEPYDRHYDKVGIEYKIDGCRCVAFGGEKISLFTRNGKPIKGFSLIEEELAILMKEHNVVLDGEIVGTDYKDTMNKLFADAEGKIAKYMIFDVVPLEDFQKGICKQEYIDRKIKLEEIFASKTFKYLELVRPVAILNNPTAEQLSRLMDMATSRGFEGIMIKKIDSPYVCKRSYFWQKLKPFQTAEFTIIDFEEGEGRLAGTLGKVIIDVNGVAVGVGSGYNDAERAYIWSHREQCLGRLIEVQYSRVLEDSGSLLFPTVKGFRFDIE